MSSIPMGYECEVCRAPATTVIGEVTEAGSQDGWKLYRAGNLHTYCDVHTPTLTMLPAFKKLIDDEHLEEDA